MGDAARIIGPVSKDALGLFMVCSVVMKLGRVTNCHRRICERT